MHCSPSRRSGAFRLYDTEGVDITKLQPSPDPLSKEGNLRPLMVYVLTSAALLTIATLLDRPLWQALLHTESGVGTSDWFQALRSLGYLPVWLAVAVALFLIDRQARSGFLPAASRSLILATSVLAAGCLGEILKMLIRRLRPDVAGGEYVFRPFVEAPLSSSGLGMPSGHAMVAFAAAWALCRLWPAASVVWIAAAIGCAASRVIDQAHFASDTVLSAVATFALVRYIWGCSRSLDHITKKRPNSARR